MAFILFSERSVKCCDSQFGSFCYHLHHHLVPLEPQVDIAFITFPGQSYIWIILLRMVKRNFTLRSTGTNVKNIWRESVHWMVITLVLYISIKNFIGTRPYPKKKCVILESIFPIKSIFYPKGQLNKTSFFPSQELSSDWWSQAVWEIGGYLSSVKCWWRMQSLKLSEKKGRRRLKNYAKILVGKMRQSQKWGDKKWSHT